MIFNADRTVLHSDVRYEHEALTLYIQGQHLDQRTEYDTTVNGGNSRGFEFRENADKTKASRAVESCIIATTDHPLYA